MPAAERVESAQPVAYLTPQAAAALLGVSVKTISRWSLEDTSMPAFRRGRVLRFERQRLLDWIARQTQGRRKSA